MSDLLERLQTGLSERYTIGRKLGEGGMAYVYLAQDSKLGRQVALKVLRPEIASTVGSDRFLGEIHTAAKLQHLHILPLFDYGDASGLLYYTMPYVKGESLRDRLQREKSLPYGEALKITRDVAAALEYAHGEGIIHRDIKPENILLSDGEAVIADFGIARAIDAAGREHPTLTGHAIGTPAYMSPEQAAGSRNLDGRSDLYSLGCTFHEMLTSRLPFEGGAGEASGKGATQRSTVIETDRTDIPEYIERVISRVLSQHPTARYSTPTEFVRALEGEEPKEAPWRRLRHALSTPLARRVTVAVAAVVLVVVVAIQLMPESPPPPTQPTAVAVLPFNVQGSEGYEFLEEGMINLLGNRLDGAGDTRAISPTMLLKYLDRSGSDRISVQLGRQAATEFGTRFYVLGDVVVSGENLRIDARLHDVESGAQPIGTAIAEGSPEVLSDLVDEVARELLGILSGAMARRLALTASQSTTSLTALEYYLEAEEAMRSGKRLEAKLAFEQAIAADSSFAMAWYGLARTTRRESKTTYARRALELADRLPAHHRMLLEAYLADAEGRPLDAEARYRAILEDYPEEVDVYVRLIGSLHTWHTLLGRPVDDEVYALSRRIQTLDPENDTAYRNLVDETMVNRDTVAFDSLVTRYLTLKPTGRNAFLFQALRTIFIGTPEEQQQLLTSLESIKDTKQVEFYLWGLAALNPDMGRELFESVRWHMARETQAAYGAILSDCFLKRGRWQEARDLIQEVWDTDPLVTSECWALLITAPYLDRPKEEYELLRDQIERWDELAEISVAGDTTSEFYRMEGPLSVVQPYLLGLLSARLNDESRVEYHATQLERIDAPESEIAYARYYAATVRALLAWTVNRSEDVLAILDATPVPMRPYYLIGTKSLDHARFLRAEALLALDRAGEALGWYETIGYFTPMEQGYRGPALFRSAEIYELQGNRDKAVDRYEELIWLWRDCDPELRPRVEEAKQRLSVLQEEDPAA